MKNDTAADAEKKAEVKVLTPMEVFQRVYDALMSLEEEARGRVLTSVATMLGINTIGAKLPTTSSKTEIMPVGENGVDENNEDSFEYDSFADLYAAVDPAANDEKALVAGYWLQICQGAKDFSGYSINKELTNLGYRLSNVTNALSSLINTKPQLALQLKKTGKSRQARKTYKLSKAGIDKVEEMIGE